MVQVHAKAGLTERLMIADHHISSPAPPLILRETRERSGRGHCGAGRAQDRPLAGAHLGPGWFGAGTGGTRIRPFPAAAPAFDALAAPARLRR